MDEVINTILNNKELTNLFDKGYLAELYIKLNKLIDNRNSIVGKLFNKLYEDDDFNNLGIIKTSDAIYLFKRDHHIGYRSDKNELWMNEWGTLTFLYSPNYGEKMVAIPKDKATKENIDKIQDIINKQKYGRKLEYCKLEIGDYWSGIEALLLPSKIPNVYIVLDPGDYK